jgi:GNAT superfamily N-acetyltransferase
MVSDLIIRTAVVDDVPLILQFVQGLADYEKLGHKVAATEDKLRQTLFGDNPSAEVLIAETDRPLGFALFFQNYSTFRASPGIFLEDLFVLPECRGLGVGRALLSGLASVCVERGCERLDWVVLEWNESAIEFYRSLDAESLDDWVTFRVSDEALQNLALSKDADDR